jgi:hypothetical protein
MISLRAKRIWKLGDFANLEITWEENKEVYESSQENVFRAETEILLNVEKMYYMYLSIKSKCAEMVKEGATAEEVMEFIENKLTELKEKK